MTARNRTTEYNESVKAVKKLLSEAESSWVNAFIILRRVENDGVWQLAKAGHSTFEEFLKVNFPDAIAYRLYRKAIHAIELYGEKLIRSIGVRSAHALVTPNLIANESDRTTIAKKLELYVSKHGVAPATKNVWEIVRSVVPESNPEGKKQRKLSDLMRENELLKIENDKLRLENEQLRKKLRAGNRTREIAAA